VRSFEPKDARIEGQGVVTFENRRLAGDVHVQKIALAILKRPRGLLYGQSMVVKKGVHFFIGRDFIIRQLIFDEVQLRDGQGR
jgi:hypothetical protein